jgi:hypothetical protein
LDSIDPVRQASVGLSAVLDGFRPEGPFRSATSERAPSDAGVSYEEAVDEGPMPTDEKTPMTPLPVAPSARDLDLSTGARQLRREQWRNRALGWAVGAVFLALGLAEVDLQSKAGFSANVVVAAALAFLGAATIWLAYRGTLTSPVEQIRLADGAIDFRTRTGVSYRIPWGGRNWEIVIQDPSPDPTVNDSQKRTLFFSAARSTYGLLGRDDVGPILDAARASGASVRMRTVPLGRSGKHIIREIRVFPSAG